MAELTGQGPIASPGATSVVFTTPFPLQLGSRAKDSAGNEYVFCSFSDNVDVGAPVVITSAFAAARPGTTGRGSVGVSAAYGTSANAGWVQIYGRAMMQINCADNGGTAPSPSDAANGPTTLSTSVPTRFKLSTSLVSPNALYWSSGNVSTGSGIYVEGMFVATDTSLGVSPGVSEVCNTTSGVIPIVRHTGAQVAVFLNYPTLTHRNYGE